MGCRECGKIDISRAGCSCRGEVAGKATVSVWLCAEDDTGHIVIIIVNDRVPKDATELALPKLGID